MYILCPLQHLNEILAEKFDQGDNIDGLMATSIDILLPCLSQMKNTAFKDDDTAVEEIGNRWCAFLGQDLSSKYNLTFIFAVSLNALHHPQNNV